MDLTKRTIMSLSDELRAELVKVGYEGDFTLKGLLNDIDNDSMQIQKEMMGVADGSLVPVYFVRREKIGGYGYIDQATGDTVIENAIARWMLEFQFNKKEGPE